MNREWKAHVDFNEGSYNREYFSDTIFADDWETVHDATETALTAYADDLDERFEGHHSFEVFPSENGDVAAILIYRADSIELMDTTEVVVGHGYIERQR